MKGIISLPGGKVKKNESSVDAAIRECIEETSVYPSYPKHIGNIKILRPEYQISAFGDELIDLRLDVDVFFTTGWSSNHHIKRWPYYYIPSNECGAFWVRVEEVPIEKMVPDSFYWFREAINGCSNIQGSFIYNDDKLHCYDVSMNIKGTK
jgi:8-oxo-dGTP pyrophosphatase MutT (NUDIX family)